VRWRARDCESERAGESRIDKRWREARRVGKKRLKYNKERVGERRHEESCRKRTRREKRVGEQKRRYARGRIGFKSRKGHRGLVN